MPEELWRADTVVKAHDDVEEVGQTTLGTRVATGVALGFIFSAWVFSTPSLFAAGHALQAIAAERRSIFASRSFKAPRRREKSPARQRVS